MFGDGAEDNNWTLERQLQRTREDFIMRSFLILYLLSRITCVNKNYLVL